jgi:hypothetical protein
MSPRLPHKGKRCLSRTDGPVLTVHRDGDPRHDPATVAALGLDPAGVEARCFGCGDRVEHPAVLWHGMVGEPVYLHPVCAADLARGLLLDVERLSGDVPLSYHLAQDEEV